jgi:uncharacterized damage-inducible protein DinB
MFGPATSDLLQRNVDAVYAARSRTLTLIANLTQREMDRRPNPTKWSIGEVVDHLLLFDRFLIQDIERLIDAARSGRPTVIQHSFSDVDVAPAFFPKALLPLVEFPVSLASLVVPASFRDMLARTRFIRFQHPEFANPRQGRPVEQLRQELQAFVEGMENLLLEMSGMELDALRVRHPLLGDNNLAQLLSFMASHEKRHHGQIEELKRKLPSDGAAREASMA